MIAPKIYDKALDNARAAVELKVAMERPQLCKLLLKFAHKAVERKAVTDRKTVLREIFLKQFEEVEDELVVALQPMFTSQIQSIASRLILLDVSMENHQQDNKALAPVSDQAQDLIAQAFDPAEWRDELVNRALPVMAKKMLEAARAQLRVMGFDNKSIVVWRDKHLADRHNQMTHGKYKESQDAQKSRL